MTITIRDPENITPNQVAEIYKEARSRFLEGTHRRAGPNTRQSTVVLGILEFDMILNQIAENEQAGRPVDPEWRPEPTPLLNMWRARASEFGQDPASMLRRQSSYDYRNRVPIDVFRPGIELALQPIRYAPLERFLTEQPRDITVVQLAFNELEDLLGFELPDTAKALRSWWANTRRRLFSRANSWLSAGWKVTNVDFEKGNVSFERSQSQQQGGNMASRRGKGEGSIRQRKNGLWEAAITIGQTDSGNPKRRSIYGKTRKEVAKKLAELLDQQNKGLLLEPSRLTVAEAVNRWIDNKTNVNEGTSYKYHRETAGLLDLIGHLRLQDLRAPHIRTAYTTLAKQGASVRAQKKAAGHLRAAMREAMHDGLITRNFAEGIRVSTPRVQKAAQAWTPTEVSAFLEAARDDPLYPVFYLMLTLGLRRGEVLGLPWDVVDFAAATIRIKQALVLQGKGNTPAIRPVKTPNSRRVLHMSQDVLEVLENQRGWQREQRAFMGSDWHDTGLVFTTTIGTPLHPRNALRSFKRIVQGVDITPIRLHDLRHTHASLALQRGLPVEVVSERLGHARVDITLNTYRHLYEAERQEAALSLNQLLTREPRTVN